MRKLDWFVFWLVAVTLIAPMSAQTGAWTPPVVLSTGGQGWEAAAAIDGNGNSVALWDERTTQDQLWSRSKPSAGNWGSVTQVSPALQTTSVFPAVRISTQDSPQQYGAIKAACGQPIARPLRTGIPLSF